MSRVATAPTRRTPPIHQGVLSACAFVGGESRLATASADGAIVIWDTNAGQPVERLAAHKGPILALGWDARRRRVISGGHDRRLAAWELDTGEVATLAEHPAGLYALAISPNGEQLASGGYDPVIRLWRLADGSPLGELPGHDGAVLDLAFLDDERLVSCGRDYQVVVWDVTRRIERLRTAGHRRWAMRVGTSADGGLIFSGGEDGQVCGWSADTGARLWRTQFASPVWGLERTADGTALIVGAGGLAARLDLGPVGPSEPRPIATETARVISRSDGGLIALGADNVILYRSNEPDTPLRRLSLRAPNYASVAALRCPTGAGEHPAIAAVMTRANGQVDLDLDRERRSLAPAHRGLAFASCVVGRAMFATVGFDGMIHLRRAVDGALVRTLDHGGFIFSVGASTDGSRLLAVGNDALSLWDIASGERIWGESDLGVGFHVWGALSRDGRFAVAVGEGPHLYRWTFAAGGPRRERFDLDFGRLIGTCGLMAVAIIDDATMAVATAAGEVRRVDLATSVSTLLHATHESGVRASMISPNGRRLLSFSENGLTAVFDLQAGGLCTPDAIANAVVPAACFTPDDDLVWVDGEGALHVEPATD